ncbi:MAG: hypothetical protein ACREQN_11670 [Candidatus Binataceae bacterium]
MTKRLTTLIAPVLAIFIVTVPAWAQKISVDSARHIHYGALDTPAVFPMVIYDFNPNLCGNPANEYQSLLAPLSFDTIIDVVCDSPTDAKNIASVMASHKINLWSTVPWGIGYTGSDPGWVDELAGVPNVTGYFITDEPDVLGGSPGDITLTNDLVAAVKAVDPSALQVTSFNDGSFGGSFPNYGGGPFSRYLGNEITIDVLGNSFWNASPPRSSNGLYDVTRETNVWDQQANSVHPKVPLITDIAFYGPAGNANCYLTRQQTYSEAWTAVANNADGLAWWALGQGETSGGPMCDGGNETFAQLMADLAQETRKVRAIAPTIVSPVDHWYSHTQAESVVQTTGRAGWIFASNLTEDPVTDTFSGLPAGTKVIAYAGNPDGSDRLVCTSCGSGFTDQLPGFVAYAYQVTSSTSASPTPTPTPTPTVQPPAPTPTPTTRPRTPTPTPTAEPPTPTPTPTPSAQRHHHRHWTKRDRWGTKSHPRARAEEASAGNSRGSGDESATSD